MPGLIGRKVGMMRIFDSKGRDIPVTIIQTGPCVVVQIKTSENDGYDAVQLGFGDKKENRINKPKAGHFKKGNVSPKEYLMEFPINRDRKPKVGTLYTVSIFKVGDKISVRGVSKGRGFAGVVKRYGFRGGSKTHGQSDRLRAPGSIGQSSDPSRVWRGMKMPGHMGNENVSVKNLEVVRIDENNHCLFVKGAVPGASNGIVTVVK